MTEQQERSGEEAVGDAGPGVAPVTPESTPAISPEVEEGKIFAILSYVLSLICIPFFLVPLIMRNNEFSLYHAKQCLMLWLVGIVGSVVSAILMVVCIGLILSVVVGVFCLVLAIIGLINASKGAQKPLPVIGALAEDWFKGLRKVQA